MTEAIYRVELFETSHATEHATNALEVPYATVYADLKGLNDTCTTCVARVESLLLHAQAGDCAGNHQLLNF